MEQTMKTTSNTDLSQAILMELFGKNIDQTQSQHKSRGQKIWWKPTESAVSFKVGAVYSAT